MISATWSRLAAGFLVVSVLLVSFPAHAAVIDVACDTAELAAAINTANANAEADVINLATGCLYEFTAGDVSNPDTALPEIYSEIEINGNGATIARADGSPDFRLVYSFGGNLILNDLTITGGRSNSGGGVVNNAGALMLVNSSVVDNYALSEAGGILNGGPLTLINSIVSGNSSPGSGGGIYSTGGSLATLINSTVIGNSSSVYGGGIYSVGSVTLESSSVDGNFAVGAPSGSRGGGIYCSGVLNITNSTVNDNTASPSGAGAGIFSSSAATIINSTVAGNSASATGSFGGGIYNSGPLTIINSTVSDNDAGDSGSGIIDITGSVTVLNSTISGNSAVNVGGGIYFNFGSDNTLANNTISGNSADQQGGGIYVSAGIVTTVNNTFAGNRASVSGGALFNGAGTVTVANSILWGNSSQISVGPGTVTVNYSIVEGGYFGGTGNSIANPLFVSPVSYLSAPTIAGDYHVQANSPALNVGSNAALPADTLDLDNDSNTAEPIPYDRDGNSRIVNATVDMGAYEHQTLAAVVVSETSVDVAEGGATDTYSVHLASRPASSVTVTPAGDADCDVSAALTFTTDNWSSAQTVTVTAVDDDIFEGSHSCTITNTATSGDAAYNGIGVAGVGGTVTDDDTAGVDVTPTTVDVTEGSTTDTYDVVLNSEPTADVTITPEGDADCSVSAALTFTNANWDTPQSVTVTAVDDDIEEGEHGCTINNTSASDDLDYDGVSVASVDGTVTDNDLELLINGSFEAGIAPWAVTTLGQDKVKDKNPYDGLFAFRFKGFAGKPSAKLKQTILAPPIADGDIVTARAQIQPGSAANGKMILKVKTDLGTVFKDNVAFDQGGAYVLHQIGLPITLGIGEAVADIKLQFKDKSLSGKVYVDAVRVTVTIAPAPRTVTRAPILPPPAAPDGFRGGN
ncbi:MAG: right-handed parallel beta-helix repeat-containing protein [Chloroflexi bacterium]|nr:right-handed parallel beta-helix repeat-containing protein [Chloroflexota bacterium]